MFNDEIAQARERVRLAQEGAAAAAKRISQRVAAAAFGRR